MISGNVSEEKPKACLAVVGTWEVGDSGQEPRSLGMCHCELKGEEGWVNGRTGSEVDIPAGRH